MSYATLSTAAGGDMDTDGHGTSSAAILVGNASLGDAMAGVTQGSLDCFTVYGPEDTVLVSASVKGFEYAVARLDQVIVAEMQDNTATDIADVSAAADHAYAAGALVIAANGNTYIWGSGEPARSRRVIGVGAYYLEGEYDLPGAWGLTVDERVKPDLQAPSYTETASNSNDLTQYFGATSGATPYAAGAASLLRNWMVIGSNGIDPGQVYSHLILAGDKKSPFDALSSTGAGKFRLPETGTSWWGKIWVSNSVKFVEIPVAITATGNMRIQAAIWWPEEPVVAAGGVPIDGHNDIDVRMLGPRGAKADGESRVGVFERVEWTGVATGSWRLRLKPITMRKQPQIIYWGFSAVPSP